MRTFLHTKRINSVIPDKELLAHLRELVQSGVDDVHFSLCSLLRKKNVMFKMLRIITNQH